MGSAAQALGVTLAFVLAVAIGFVVGRNGVDEQQVAVSPETQTPVSSTTPSSHSPRPHRSPSPSQVPSGPVVTAEGQVLRPGPHPVVAGAESVGCKTLIRPGYSGDCGAAATVGGRTIWVTETKPVPGLASAANFAHVYTFSPDLNGWVEQLRANDPQARLWTNIRVAATDLTGDGDPELVFAFHYLGSGSDLGLDIVVNDDGVPVVAAHPDDAVHGSVVLRDGKIDQYQAQFPGDAPNCCPPFFLRRTIEYREGAFRVTSVGKVDPDQVPASSL